jgi:hypothetical protein
MVDLTKLINIMDVISKNRAHFITSTASYVNPTLFGRYISLLIFGFMILLMDSVTYASLIYFYGCLKRLEITFCGYLVK